MQEDRAREPAEDLDGAGRPARRLSTRLLWLTILSIMAAEILIFVPSVANFRFEWLRQKIETAAVAGLAAEIDAPGDAALLSPAQEESLLRVIGAEVVAIEAGGVSRLLATSELTSMVDLQVDLRDRDPLTLISGAFDTLLFGGSRMMRITGPVGDSATTAEVVIGEHALRRAMLIYARNILALSLIIAVFAALLVFVAINMLLIRPIRRMTRSMIRFGRNPADPARIIRPSRRRDEIGLAEAELAGMQTTLARTLREQRHLADLGLAVSKINHDLRNILASAQIVSDRLAELPDPRVQRSAPMLIKSLDRALSYTQSVLAYGRAVESSPVRRWVNLHLLVAEVEAGLALPPDSGISFINSVPKDLEIEVDPDQFYRALSNLARNSVQAIENDGNEAVIRRIAIKASRNAAGETLVAVDDTGPGLPERAKENLFKAFRGSARSGGTGLGLAIAAEIVEAHGGEIRLAERNEPGARFEIRLPRRSGALTETEE